MIFAPGQLPRIPQKISPGDVMIVADLAAPRPGEEGLRAVGAGVVVGVLDGVVDPPGVEAGMQRVPGRGFVGVDRRGAIHARLDEVERRVLAGEHRRQRAAQAGSGQRPLPDHDDHLALAALVPGQAPILAVLFPVLRADVAAEVGPVHLDLPAGAAEPQAPELQAQGLADLVLQHEGGLVLDAQVARQRQRRLPTRLRGCRLFTSSQKTTTAAKYSRMPSLWKANSVPEVSEKS